jgi:hypothetical protein
MAKLYKNVERYSAEDCWYFDIPLAIWLCKPLCSRRHWLVNARKLLDKSVNCASIGQTTMNHFCPHLPSTRTARNTVLERSWKTKSLALMLY